MRIRRLSLVLPASHKRTAAHDARQIAEAVGKAVRETRAAPLAPISIDARGRNAASLALEASGRIRTAGPRDRRGGG